MNNEFEFKQDFVSNFTNKNKPDRHFDNANRLCQVVDEERLVFEARKKYETAQYFEGGVFDGRKAFVAVQRVNQNYKHS